MNGRRCHSAPPWSYKDIGSFKYDVRLGPPGWNPPLLYVDLPLRDWYAHIHDVNDLGEARVLSNTRVFILDHKHVLKLMSPLVDVAAVVATMRLAGSVVPVPRVIDYGRSGNCCYILMDFVDGYELGAVLESIRSPLYSEAMMKPQIDDVVRKLAGVGLAHNDLYARNIIVDHDWKIIGILDWDNASNALTSVEYGNRVQRVFQRQVNWNDSFLRHSPDRLGTLAVNCTDGVVSFRRPRPPFFRIVRPPDEARHQV